MASYVPTDDELNDEVADILIELEERTPSAREVWEVLQQRQSSWDVPEHLVAKYVDDVMNLTRGEFGLGPPTDDDDSVRSGASRGSVATTATAGTTGTNSIASISGFAGTTTTTTTTGGNNRHSGSGSHNDDNGDRRSRFIVKGASYSIGKILSGKTKAAKQQLGITRLDRRKMHFKAPQKSRPRRGSSNRNSSGTGSGNANHNSSSSSSNNNDYMYSDHSSSDHTGDDCLLPHVVSSVGKQKQQPSQSKPKTTPTSESTDMDDRVSAMDCSSQSKDSPEDDAKVQKVPPRRPQRTVSDTSDREDDMDESGMSSSQQNATSSSQPNNKARELPPRNSSFAEVDVDKIANGAGQDEGDDDDDDDDDDELMEEANKRSKFMMKGGSHSIQKVLKGEARKKKGFSRFDRRAIKKEAAPAQSNEEDVSGGPEDECDRGHSASSAGVDDEVLNVLGDSYSENVDVDTDDGEEFAAEVARRSKFIAKGGTHSIKKVLAGEARSSGKSGPSRINRRNLPLKQSPNSKPTADDKDPSESAEATTETNNESRVAPRPPMRSISVDSTDSQIEDEASRRSRFMLKGASHSIRNLLAGKTKKDKGVSRLDRRKLHFKHESDAVHYTEQEHKKPEEINEARLKAEAEARERTAARKAQKALPRRPQRKLTQDDEEVSASQHETSQHEPSTSQQDPSTSQQDQPDDDDDSEIVAEADRRSLLFKGGSHSIRNLFAGKGKKGSGGMGGGGIGRFNRRKMGFKKEAEAIHYTEKPHLKPAEINARHQQEAARLRQNEEVSAAKAKANKAAPSYPTRRISADSENDSKLDLGEEESKKAVYAEIEYLHGEQDDTEKGDDDDDNVDADSDADNDLDADDDILEEANLRSNFMMKGGSYSIQKVLRGDARKKEGVTRFDRRKMHFKHESEAIHSHDHDGEKKGQKKARDAEKSVEPEPTKSTVPNDQAEDNISVDSDDADTDILEEADRRSKFMMKGGSYSIQKVLRGEAKKKEGVTRFDRRKMHFKHESEAIHCHDHDGQKQPGVSHDSDTAAPPSAAVDDEGYDSAELDDNDDDVEIIQEANKRSKFMMKGGSHSIQKVLRGEARKKEGVTRFDRRKMHFKNESQAPAEPQKQTPANKDTPARVPVRRVPSDVDLESAKSDSGGAQDDSEEFDDEELELLAQAENDPRRQMMLKGASHSIRNIFSGKAKKKEKPAAAGMERRKSQLKNASIRGMGEGSKEFSVGDEHSESKINSPKMDEEEMAEELKKEKETIDEKTLDRRSKFSLKGASNSIRNLLSRKHGRKEGQKAIDAEIERLHSTNQDDVSGRGGNESDADLDEEDREILEEANRRSNFMAKGASYSITKVLSGSAKKKKEGITRFDRRKMQLKKEAEAVHSHDAKSKSNANTDVEEQPSTQLPPEDAKGESEEKPSKEVKGENHPTQTEKRAPENSGGDTVQDDPDDEDADIIEEADKRSKFMSKGGSYSIQKVLKGEARAKKGVSRFDRRKMHFKKESAAIHSHDGDQKSQDEASAAPSPPSPTVEHQPEPNAQTQTSVQQLPTETTNAKMPSRRISDSDETPVQTDAQKKAIPTDVTVGTADEKLDNAEADADVEGGGDDRRKRFTLKGASHSIKKVLAGKARAKKETGVSRLDRRRIQLKSKATPGGVPQAKSPVDK